MADARVEYRFVSGAFTPDTITQARLAQYLAALSALYGEEKAVHFIRVEPGSLQVVSRIDEESAASVAERIESADTDEPLGDAGRAYGQIQNLVNKDGHPAYIGRGPAKLLRFRSSSESNEPLTFGPFWQQGDLSGTVILVGGKGDPASVKLLDANGDTHLCKARRDVIKRLRDYLYEEPVRITGRGKWFRSAEGCWRLEQFDIFDFAPLNDEPLDVTIARLQAIDAEWKERPDPIGEIDKIRYG